MSAEAGAMHVMRIDDHAPGGRTVICACGWRAQHPRGKVLAAKARRHYGKHGIVVDQPAPKVLPEPEYGCEAERTATLACPPIEEVTLL